MTKLITGKLENDNEGISLFCHEIDIMLSLPVHGDREKAGESHWKAELNMRSSPRDDCYGGGTNCRFWTDRNTHTSIESAFR